MTAVFTDEQFDLWSEKYEVKYGIDSKGIESGTGELISFLDKLKITKEYP